MHRRSPLGQTLKARLQGCVRPNAPTESQGNDLDQGAVYGPASRSRRVKYAQETTTHRPSKSSCRPSQLANHKHQRGRAGQTDAGLHRGRFGATTDIPGAPLIPIVNNAFWRWIGHGGSTRYGLTAGTTRIATWVDGSFKGRYLVSCAWNAVQPQSSPPW